MNIGFFELEGWEKEYIQKELPKQNIQYVQNTIQDELADQAEAPYEAISIFIDSRIDEQVLTKLPHLKLITTRSTGYDHIDLAACTKRGIQVANVPGYGEDAVAEYTFGLLLALTRKLYPSMQQVKAHCDFSLNGLRGSDLHHKTLGVIGTGKIGRSVIRIAQGFGMNVVAYDLYPDQHAAQELHFSYHSLEDVLKQSDVLSLHCPLTPETTHLLNRKNIPTLKKGVFIVNTARGGLIETEALVDGLKDGTIAGAALDVLEEEDDIKDEARFLSKATGREEELKKLVCNHVLIGMPQVLITPHNAFNSNEAIFRILRTTIDNIHGFINGTPFALVEGKTQ